MPDLIIPPDPPERQPASTGQPTHEEMMALLQGDPLTWEDRATVQKSLMARVRNRKKGRRVIRPRMAQADDTSSAVLDFDRAVDRAVDRDLDGVEDPERLHVHLDTIANGPSEGVGDPELLYRVHVRQLRKQLAKERRTLRTHARLLIKHPRFQRDVRRERATIGAGNDERRVGRAAMRLLQEPRYTGLWDTLRDYYRVPAPLIEQAVKAALRGTWDDAVRVIVGAVEVMHVDKEQGDYADRLAATSARERNRARKDIQAAMPAAMPPEGAPRRYGEQMAVYRVWRPWHERHPDARRDRDEFARLAKGLTSADFTDDGKEAREALGSDAIDILRLGWPRMFTDRVGKEGKPRGVDQSTIRKKLDAAILWLDHEEQARYEGRIAEFEQERRRIVQQQGDAEQWQAGWLERIKAKDSAPHESPKSL